MEWEELFNKLLKAGEEKFSPVAATFEITPLCNFSCKMCYIKLDANELKRQGKVLDVNQWIEIGKQCKKLGVLYITLTGGEVLAYTEFKYLYETLYDMGFLITILSNGYLLDEERIKWLSKRKPSLYRITLYGASDEVYEKVCLIKNGFTTVSKNILSLKEEGIKVSTCMTVISDNVADVDKVRDWTKDNGIAFSGANDYIKQPVRGATRELEGIRIRSYYKDEDVSQNEENYYCLDVNPFEHCRKYRTSFSITWQGNMIGCNSLNKITEPAIGADLYESFVNLWNRLGELRKPAKCITCKYRAFCNPCPGMLATEDGNPEKVNPYLCEVAYRRFVEYEKK